MSQLKTFRVDGFGSLLQIFEVDLWQRDRQALQTPRGWLAPARADVSAFQRTSLAFFKHLELGQHRLPNPKEESSTVIHLRNRVALTDSRTVLGCPPTGGRRGAPRATHAPARGGEPGPPARGGARLTLGGDPTADTFAVTLTPRPGRPARRDAGLTSAAFSPPRGTSVVLVTS